MTVGSGLKCCAYLPSAGPAGLLVRTLAYAVLRVLGTSQWASPVCLLTWKPRAMKSGRLYFQLAPSVPRTAAIGSGLLPTPTTDSQNDRSKSYAQGGTPLALAVKLLPTPIANDAANQTCSPSRMGKAKAPGLTAVLTRQLLPTPTAGPATTSGSSATGGPKLTEALSGLLPTPVASEAGQGNPNDPKRGQKLTTALTWDQQEQQWVVVGQLLNPRFVLEMMGFPPDWCDLTEAEMKQVRKQLRAMRKQTRATGPATPSKPPETPWCLRFPPSFFSSSPTTKPV